MKKLFFLSTILISIASYSQKIKAQSPKKITLDNYPVTDQMFGSDVNSRKIKSGEIFSDDKIWFHNDTLNQTLVFELYTDNFRNVIFHFKNDDIPKELIKRMELHSEDGELTNEKLKEKHFSGFLKSANKINQKHFQTNKGFKLGDLREKAIKEYGRPDRISKRDGIEKYEWDFVGDIGYDPKKDKSTKPSAEDSFGHQITMFFRNNKLIGIIFYNDIP